MPYFIYTDLISSLLDLRLVDPGSTLIHVDAYDPNWLTAFHKQNHYQQKIDIFDFRENL